MSPIATHPLSRVTTGTINPDGVDIAIFSAGVDLPETGHCSYTVALHEDGASCPPECGCVDAEARTTIWEGTAITRGEWTWHADRYVLIGWRSTGPTKPELRERIEYLEEALTDEQELHRDAKRHMNDDSRLIDGLRTELREAQAVAGQRDEALGWLADAEVAHLDTATELRGYRAAAWAAGVVALLLSVALVWAVIA